MKIVEAYFINKILLRINSLFSRAEVTISDDSRKIQSLQVKVNEDEVLDNIERFQDYGFTSNPLQGAEAVLAFAGGKRSNGFIIKVDDRRYRLKALEKGEVAIYTDEGDKIHFKRGKQIDVETSILTINTSAKVVVNTKDAEVNAEKTTVTSPEVDVISSTKVSITTPLLKVSGLVTCGGLAAGGASPASGKVSVAGSIDVTGDVESGGNVKDAIGTMDQMRSIYNSHTHQLGSSTTTTPQGTM